MNILNVSDVEVSTLDTFDDVIDCAILDDDNMVGSISDIENSPATTEPDDDDDLIDATVDYSDDLHEPDFVDVDAESMIAAERDLLYDPFEDEEIVDAISNGEDVLLDDEDNYIEDEDGE